MTLIVAQYHIEKKIYVLKVKKKKVLVVGVYDMKHDCLDLVMSYGIYTVRRGIVLSN